MMKKILLILVCMFLLVGTVMASDYRFQNSTPSDLVVINGDTGNLTVTGNIATEQTGFFGWLGSITSRITKLWVQDIDFSGNVSGTGNIITTSDLGVRNINATGNASIGQGNAFLEIFFNGDNVVYNSIITNYFTKGIIVNGTVNATSFIGDGSNLTGLDNKFLFTNGSNSEPLLNLSEDLAAQDIFVTRINTSGDVRISGRLIVGVGPTNIGILEKSGVGIDGGPLIVNHSIQGLANPNGVSISLTEASEFVQREFRLTNSASYFADKSLLCDSNDPFTIDDSFRSIGLVNLSDFTIGLSAPVLGFINSSCVIFSPQVRPDFELNDISPTSYLISNAPIKIIYDNGAEISTHVGKNSKHVINFKNNSEEMLKIDAIGGEDNQILAEFSSDINGKLGFTSIRSFIESSKDVNDTITHNLIVETDLTNSNGGEYHAIEIDILNPNDTKATAIVIDSEFDNLVLVTKQEDASKIWLNDSSSLTNITNNVLGDSISTSIYPTNGSTLYIGNLIDFTQVSFGLDVNANEDIDLVGFFCNSSGWSSLDINDGTNGMQGTGSISFQTPETRGTCNFQLDGTNFPAGENFTYIALQRTNPSVAITPNATLIELVIDSSLIRIGNVEGGSGAEDSFSFINEEPLGPGEPHTAFYYTDSSGNKRVGSWFTSRANETASGNSNSWIVAPDNDLVGDDKLNLTITSNAVQRIFNYYGETSPVDFDSGQNRTSAFVLYALLTQQIYLSDALGNGLLSVFGDANFFIRDGEEMDIVGDVHIQKTTIVPTGFLPGETVDLINENFEDGTLDPFVQISSGGGASEWTVLSDANCPDGSCARAVGGATSPPRIMEANFSTQPFNNLNFTFNLTTINLDSGDIFNVTINNNSGSGEQQIFVIDDGSDVVNAKINPVIPLNMNNASIVSLRYYLIANVLNEEAFVDLVLFTGNATEDTTANVSRGDASLTLGFNSDGFSYEGPEVTGRSTLNISADDINFVGNTTFTSVTQTTLNITESINVAENITIGDSINMGGGNGGYTSNATCPFIVRNSTGSVIHYICN